MLPWGHWLESSLTDFICPWEYTAPRSSSSMEGHAWSTSLSSDNDIWIITILSPHTSQWCWWLKKKNQTYEKLKELYNGHLYTTPLDLIIQFYIPTTPALQPFESQLQTPWHLLLIHSSVTPLRARLLSSITLTLSSQNRCDSIKLGVNENRRNSHLEVKAGLIWYPLH